jgi:hypothetical protein
MSTKMIKKCWSSGDVVNKSYFTILKMGKIGKIVFSCFFVGGAKLRKMNTIFGISDLKCGE